MRRIMAGGQPAAPTFLMIVMILLGVTLFPACRRHSDAPTAAATHAGYHCPMHPQYHSDRPGDCPICGMRLVTDEVSSGETQAVPGQADVQLSAAGEQLIGVRVASATVRDLYRVIRASARVAYDPGLYSAILEHQEAVRALKNAPASSPFHAEAEDTVRASSLRLRQMGLSDNQVERASQPGFDPANLLLGQAGANLWVYADLYENEAGLVHSGSRVHLTAQAFPGRTFEGTVRAVDRVVNSETRTLRARIETPNPDGLLRPDMYLNAAIEAPIGTSLAIPESALLDTGTRQLVFVQTAPGHFEPREVRVGREGDGYYEVLSGLQPGETVSTSANFLLDSESKLRASQ